MHWSNLNTDNDIERARSLLNKLTNCVYENEKYTKDLNEVKALVKSISEKLCITVETAMKIVSSEQI